MKEKPCRCLTRRTPAKSYARRSSTGDMALRIEKAFGPKMGTLMGMQSAFDIFQTRRRARTIRVRRWRALRAEERVQGTRADQVPDQGSAPLNGQSSDRLKTGWSRTMLD